VIGIGRYRNFAVQSDCDDVSVHLARKPTDSGEACRVCGSTDPLSFEHLPPRAANNSTRAWMYGMDDWLARDELSGRPAGRAVIQQRGSGVYSLCKRCNERAGSTYVPDYLDWVRHGEGGLVHVDPPLDEADQLLEPLHVTTTFKDVRPARFLKQVVTMLLAICPAEFGRQHLDLMSYAQDPGWVGMPERYQFYVALFAGPQARYIGGAARLKERAGRWDHDFVVELAYPPFALSLTVDEPEPAIQTACISNFADVDIDARGDATLTMLFGFGHVPFPLDYRTLAMLERDRRESQQAA
jgi:hypothetical protein